MFEDIYVFGDQGCEGFTENGRALLQELGIEGWETRLGSGETGY